MDDSSDKPVADDVATAAATVEEERVDEEAGGGREEAPESESTKRTSTNPSEYDSADSFSDASAGERRAPDSDDDDAAAGSATLEREDGDGQESVQSRKVDDDEDKKNPQYIPKRGTFYEHDDRTAEDNDDALEDLDKDKEKDAKKKIWTDKKERWCHDKFNDNDQAPKSKQELVAIYGYDIRNEDGPPRARRRRRYGRGPNKYTRNWEDEDAYNKAPPIAKKPAPKKNRPRQDDPDVVGQEDEDKSAEVPNSEDCVETKTEQSSHQTKPRDFVPRTNHASNNAKNQRVGTGRIVKPNREIRDSDYRGFTKPRQFTKSSHSGAEDANSHTRNFTNRKHAAVEDMARLSLNEPPPREKNKPHNRHPPPQQQQPQQVPVPPRLQGEPKGASKRYSSLRQRSLPETSNAAYNQPTHGYYQGGQATTAPIQPMQAQMPAIPPPPLPAIRPPQVPVTSTPLPPQFGAPFPQAPPPFMQPPPPPFMPPQMNYVQGQPPYAPPQGAFAGYQQPFNPVSQPTEIFQPPGGITYYSTQEQQAAQQRAALQKRPKAAIPIVPPPPHEPRGRGRINQEGGGVGGDALLYEDVAAQP